MKKFKFIALLIAMLASIGFVASCGGDDKDDPEQEASLVGTWKRTYTWGYETVTFKKDGTGLIMEVDDYDSGYTDVEEFKWSLKGKILSMSFREDYYGSYSSGNGWETERFEIVSLDETTLVLKHLPDDDDYYDSYYGQDYAVWTRQ